MQQPHTSSSSSDLAAAYRQHIKTRLAQPTQQPFRCQTACTSQQPLSIDSDHSQPFPFLMFRQSVPDTHLTITSVHKGKELSLPGNVLVFLVREMMQNAIDQTIKPAVRLGEKSQSAVSSCDTIESAQDWVRYEGIFDGFKSRPAQPLPINGAFQGLVRIPLNSHEHTTAKFKFKVTPTGRVLYAYLNDPDLIQHMTTIFGHSRYANEDDEGLSYREMTDLISEFKRQKLKRT